MQSTNAGRMRGARLVLMLILIALPLLIQTAVLIWGEGRGGSFDGFVKRIQGAYLGFALPLLLIFLGTSAFGDEWEGGTAAYVVGLPLPRWTLVIGRWLVTVRRALVFVLPAVGLMYVLCLIDYEGAIGHYMGDLLWIGAGVCLMGLGYGAVFLFLGLVLRRPVVVAFLIYLIELFVSYLPQSFARTALSYHVRNLLWLQTGHARFLDRGVELGLATDPVSTGGSIFAVVLYVTIFLSLATFVLTRRECSGSVAPPEGGGSSG